MQINIRRRKGLPRHTSFICTYANIFDKYIWILAVSSYFHPSISHSDGPLFEMADVVEHSQLMNMVERTFPELDQKGCNNVYKNILECMTYKEHVWEFFSRMLTRKVLKLKHMLMNFLFSDPWIYSRYFDFARFKSYLWLALVLWNKIHLDCFWWSTETCL